MNKWRRSGSHSKGEPLPRVALAISSVTWTPHVLNHAVFRIRQGLLQGTNFGYSDYASKKGENGHASRHAEGYINRSGGRRCGAHQGMDRPGCPDTSDHHRARRVYEEPAATRRDRRVSSLTPWMRPRLPAAPPNALQTGAMPPGPTTVTRRWCESCATSVVTISSRPII
jgi:hypothetical protein